MASVPWVALSSTRCHYRCGCNHSRESERVKLMIVVQICSLYWQVHVNSSWESSQVITQMVMTRNRDLFMNGFTWTKFMPISTCAQH